MPNYDSYMLCTNSPPAINSSSNGNSNSNKRKSHLLSLDPVDYTLHFSSNNLFAPRQTTAPHYTTLASSTPHSPSPHFRPPTPGGGPLSSHPTNPEDFRGFPSLIEPPGKRLKRMASDDTTSNKENRPRIDSFRTPLSPASGAMPPPPAPLSSRDDTNAPFDADVEKTHSRRPSGVRKLLSLKDIRASFSSSRTSLHSNLYPRQSQDTSMTNDVGTDRPSSPAVSLSTAAASAPVPPSGRVSQQSGTFNSEGGNNGIEYKRKKHGGWFKRHSELFAMNQNVAAVEEDAANRPGAGSYGSSNKRKQQMSLPMLPEVGSLGGGSLTGGEVGWDEARFK
ncbi:hypothetical protein K431DRAFT_283298 [Polychaeton citri CBS 116435]|uniref:Uncharacterized protein n=1 Tax=Polychaeton citri CBS 116435 TaxID=1314669 RepID=A0A9P4UP68_9PEZI|nr:hypothetical protein K431DRAFT_283298 [Polychaeton citri CBS 116435]